MSCTDNLQNYDYNNYWRNRRNSKPSTEHDIELLYLLAADLSTKLFFNSL
jgi:hypothetical protein